MRQINFRFCFDSERHSQTLIEYCANIIDYLKSQNLRKDQPSYKNYLTGTPKNYIIKIKLRYISQLNYDHTRGGNLILFEKLYCKGKTTEHIIP